MTLDDPIKNLSGVGPKMAEKMQRLGINTIRDLLFYYPRRYDDFSNPRQIADLHIGDDTIINGEIINIQKTYTRRRWLTLVEAEVRDDSGTIKAVWFNQPFIVNLIKPGDKWLLAGKVQWDFKSKARTLAVSQYEPTADKSLILPVYPETEGLTSKFLRKLLKPLLHTSEVCKEVKEYLPEEILKSEKLISIDAAINHIHFPDSLDKLGKAKKRLAFDELFFLCLRMLANKKEISKSRAIALLFDKKLISQFVQSLPYKLTNGQRKAAWEIICDLENGKPMNRLLEGDVGSGKTVVAAIAALMVARNKFQSVWLAPTEILAQQHCENVQEMLKPFGVKVGLWTRTTKKADLEHDDLVIGTHALLQEKIHFSKLALIIVDEQHRFGVRQRQLLKETSNKGQGTRMTPHFLSMTATPIPRTLALAFYGDLDLSIINELPQGRKQVITKVVSPQKREAAYQFIEAQVRSGRQVFVICPLIESEKSKNEQTQLFILDRKSAIEEHRKLSEDVFPNLSVGLLHGKMKASDKAKTMAKFKNHELDILVATAVIEVGIDIANATIMMIESAERFGLAQLHQFRGRVGRGEHQSYCLLFSESWSQATRKRLEAMTTCNDGFHLAEVDLQLRGPGEIAGLRQSGLPDLKMASLTDKIMIEKARKEAEKIINDGLEKYPALLEIISENNQSLE